VLRNLLFDLKRTAGSEGGMDIEEATCVPDRRQDPEARYRGAELMQTVVTLLTPRELECFHLWIEGLRYEEIAGVLGIRPGTVGALLAKAVKKTRAVLLHERMWQCSKA
jgi:DNA-binding CsgD family transcriptional regulator